MQNTNIFDFLGVETDLIYQKIAALKTGDVFQADNIIVRLEKYYEIESDYEHELFYNAMSCYQYLSDLLVKRGGNNGEQKTQESKSKALA
ncbi:hypothetical protein MHH70_12410 [Metasolibacillus sp. FSL H7-0170]|uniref:hypothetical protein n=1 Tax=Metasolibacillus sp. FSL H7-0170 TaxID=2921431 RepID=UPI0031587BE2